MDDNQFLESYLNIIEVVEGIKGGDTTTGIPTAAYGIVDTLGINPDDFEGNPRGLAKAVASKNIDELKRIGVDWDNLPLSMKYNALDMQFNLGNLPNKAKNYLNNLKSGNYAGALSETLDAIKAPDPVDNKQRPVKGIAKRRAMFYNIAAPEMGLSNIINVNAINQDNPNKSAKFTYALADGNFIEKPFDFFSLHSRSVAGDEPISQSLVEDFKLAGMSIPRREAEVPDPVTFESAELIAKEPSVETKQEPVVEVEESRGILDRLKDLISPDTEEEKRLKEITKQEPEILELPDELSEARDFSVLRQMYKDKKFNVGGLSLTEQMDTLQDPAVKQAKRRAKERTTDETNVEKLKDVAKFGAEFIPGVGEAMAVKRVSDALDEKDYVGAAIETAAGALGIIPVVGDVAGKALRATTKTLRKDAKLQIDNPGYDEVYGETYAEGKQKIANEAKEKALKRGETDTYASNIGTTDGITGYANKVKFKPEELKDLPGTMGEEKFRSSGEKLQKLKKDIKEKGYKEDPIMIHVREDGQPFIVEGNHRLAEALESGRDTITADIRYLRGAEEKEGLLDPKNIFPDLKNADPLEIGINPATQGGALLKKYDKNTSISIKEKSKNATAGSKEANKLIDAPVKEGSKVGIRLNLNSSIPDMPKGLDKLQTIHKNNYNGKALSYQPIATVEDVKFNVSQKGRQGIASRIKGVDVPEAKSKFPAMSVDGNFNPNRNILNEIDEDVVEIGFNPASGHLFIDMSTGQAVKSADVATVVGDRVYAKGVKYMKKSEAPQPLKASDGTELPSEVRYRMKQGGAVPMKKQMSMFDDGGLMDEGGTVDPVSGNEVPVGSTQKEVRDDIPAQLSEGEFVFPADVVRYIGLEKLMQMRQEAKRGLEMMDKMGQMGNADEAVIPDDIPFELSDLDMEDDPVEMQQGGIAGVSTVPSQVGQTPPFTVGPPTTMPIEPTPTPTPAPVPIAPTYTPATQQEVPTFTPEQMKDVTYSGVLQSPETAPKLIDIINPTTGERRTITFIPGVTEIPEGFVLASDYTAPEAQATSVTPVVGQAQVREDTTSQRRKDEAQRQKANEDRARVEAANFYKDMLGLESAKPFEDILGGLKPGTISSTGYIIGDNGERIDPVTLEQEFFGKDGVKFALKPEDKPPLNTEKEGGINRKIESLKEFRRESSRLRREKQTKEMADEYFATDEGKKLLDKARRDKEKADAKPTRTPKQQAAMDAFNKQVAEARAIEQKKKQDRKDKEKRAKEAKAVAKSRASEAKGGRRRTFARGFNEGGLASKSKPKQMRQGGLASR